MGVSKDLNVGIVSVPELGDAAVPSMFDQVMRTGGLLPRMGYSRRSRQGSGGIDGGLSLLGCGCGASLAPLGGAG